MRIIPGASLVFRFTIRDLLWLMLVVGLSITLALQHQRAMSARTRIRAALSRNLVPEVVDFVEMPIGEAALFLSVKQEVPIFVADDVDEMDNVGGLKVVTGKFRNMTLRDALEKMLPPLGLDYQVENGWILIKPRKP
jgi:hypothetical protein